MGARAGVFLRRSGVAVAERWRKVSWTSLAAIVFSVVLGPVIAGLAVARLSPFVAPPAQPAASAPQAAPTASPPSPPPASEAPGDPGGAPFEVTSLRPVYSGEDDVWVGRDPVRLSDGELTELADLRGTDQQAHDDRMADHGLAEAGLTRFEAVLRGAAPEGTRIMGMRAAAECADAPVTGTLFYSPPAGAEEKQVVYFDLDSADPVAQSTRNGSPTGEAYFDSTTYRLAQGEEVVFEMHAARVHGYCDFRIEVDVLTGDRRSTEVIDDAGAPFWVSGMAADWSDYGAAYVGGVAAPPRGDWRPAEPGDFPDPASATGP
jgi:hypothetical protein